MDLAAISAVLGNIKTATDIAKFIKDSDISIENAETKLKLAELISALADAKLEIVEVQRTLADSEAQIHSLMAKLQVKESLVWQEPAYWLKTSEKQDGPFCQKCYDYEEKLIRLQGNGEGWYECKACNSTFSTREFRARQDAQIRAYNSGHDSSF